MVRKNLYGKGNDAFTCEHCEAQVTALANGSYRNHCPFCLFAKHVDIIPGDRAETCRGMMEPTKVEHHSKKGRMIVQTCIRCGHTHRNKSAPDDAFELLCSLT